MPGKPDLDKEFEVFQTQRVRVRCATCKLDEGLRTWVEQRMLAGDPQAAIAEFLRTKGITISATALGNHKAHAVAR
jgi:SH3-like domain-containing protein